MHTATGDLFDRSAPAIAKPGSISTGFKYSALPAGIVGEARAVAKRIVDSQQLHLEMAVEAGRSLAGIKDKLGHGNWLPWLEQGCGIDQRTAQRYMATADAFGQKIYKLRRPTA
ncbi:DUF3102 domain-containing protein [Bosea sp. PAMC 26642]|uniref:DUF3102 domain-containing protein n=1 Tax=Bosea sp. (strain PAMC 26642) TaxID=1792307 RepID=UPI00076FEF2A|nr:DUF3102 domain-containing protein [Bosea sp. PAMC 26642]AMJ63040.1 hypothetical protein AXW83_24515 [Bosea sp. PAMC 26642]